MNFDWTPLSAFPKELYRVCRTGQKTAFIRPHGFLAANQDVSYFGTSQIPAFIQSIISHRRQDRIISPYISFFEDLCEAQQWCLAAEEVFGGNPTVAVINLKSPAFKYGIEERRIHGWRVVEVVQRLGLEDTILGMGAGSPRIESEWMFIGRVPEETVIKQITCDQIRRDLRTPKPPKTTPRRVPCACGAEYEFGRHHQCILSGLECGCRREELCIHFDWRFDYGLRAP